MKNILKLVHFQVNYIKKRTHVKEILRQEYILIGLNTFQKIHNLIRFLHTRKQHVDAFINSGNNLGIEISMSDKGKPALQSIHRNGVDSFFSVLVNSQHTQCRMKEIYGLNKISEFKRKKILDIVFVADHSVIHTLKRNIGSIVVLVITCKKG